MGKGNNAGQFRGGPKGSPDDCVLDMAPLVGDKSKAKAVKGNDAGDPPGGPATDGEKPETKVVEKLPHADEAELHTLTMMLVSFGHRHPALLLTFLVLGFGQLVFHGRTSEDAITAVVVVNLLYIAVRLLYTGTALGLAWSSVRKVLAAEWKVMHNLEEAGPTREDVVVLAMTVLLLAGDVTLCFSTPSGTITAVTLIVIAFAVFDFTKFFLMVRIEGYEKLKMKMIVPVDPPERFRSRESFGRVVMILKADTFIQLVVCILVMAMMVVSTTVDLRQQESYLGMGDWLFCWLCTICRLLGIVLIEMYAFQNISPWQCGISNQNKGYELVATFCRFERSTVKLAVQAGGYALAVVLLDIYPLLCAFKLAVEDPAVHYLPLASRLVMSAMTILQASSFVWLLVKILDLDGDRDDILPVPKEARKAQSKKSSHQDGTTQKPEPCTVTTVVETNAKSDENKDQAGDENNLNNSLGDGVEATKTKNKASIEKANDEAKTVLPDKAEAEPEDEKMVEAKNGIATDEGQDAHDE